MCRVCCVVRVGLKAGVAWEDGVQAIWVEGFGRVLWSVVREFWMEGELGCCWNSRWFGGDYWVELGEEWRAGKVVVWVRLGRKLEGFYRVVGALRRMKKKRKKNAQLPPEEEGILGLSRSGLHTFRILMRK